MRYEKYIEEINLIGNLVILNVFFKIGSYFAFDDINIVFKGKYFTFILILNFSWLIASFLTGINKSKRTLAFDSIIQRLVRAFALFFIFIFAFVTLHGKLNISNLDVFESYLCVVLGILFFQIGFVQFMKYWRASGRNYKKVVILGDNELTTELEEFFKQNPAHGYQLNKKVKSVANLSQVEGLIDDFRTNEIDALYVYPHSFHPEVMQQIVDQAELNFIKIYVIPDYRGFKMQSVESKLYGHIPLLKIKPIPLDDTLNRFVKRVFDIVFSLLVIVGIFSWLFPLVAILIKLESKGPVFFKQKRTGVNNNSFWCLKFRSMTVNDDSDNKQATKNDARITKIGSFLRKSSVDELPQFFNVLMGDMSVIGPRPHMLKHTEEYSRLVERFMVRHAVKPGITGLAQAKGFRGETETILAMKSRVTMDKFYVSNWSFWFDINIIFMTIDSMIRKNENAY